MVNLGKKRHEKVIIAVGWQSVPAVWIRLLGQFYHRCLKTTRRARSVCSGESFFTLSLSLSLTHTLSLSLSHTHTRTHSCQYVLKGTSLHETCFVQPIKISID